MSKLKWSEYDFTKIPFKDIVKVGQRNLLYRDIFTVSWLLGRFCALAATKPPTQKPAILLIVVVFVASL